MKTRKEDHLVKNRFGCWSRGTSTKLLYVGHGGNETQRL